MLILVGIQVRAQAQQPVGPKLTAQERTEEPQIGAGPHTEQPLRQVPLKSEQMAPPKQARDGIGDAAATERPEAVQAQAQMPAAAKQEAGGPAQEGAKANGPAHRRSVSLSQVARDRLRYRKKAMDADPTIHKRLSFEERYGEVAPQQYTRPTSRSKRGLQ